MGRKPELAALERDTLGAKIKRRRVEMNLRQVDAAPMLGVGENTLVDWEREQSTPTVGYYPAIIQFLGYEPWPEPTSRGDKLLAERRRRGWSIERAARHLGIDGGTFAGWEQGRRKPTRQSRVTCERFLRGG